MSVAAEAYAENFYVIIDLDWEDHDGWKKNYAEDGELMSITVSAAMWDRFRGAGGTVQQLAEKLLTEG